MYDDETEMLEPCHRRASAIFRFKAREHNLPHCVHTQRWPVVLCILRSLCNYMRTAGSPGAGLELQCGWMHVSGRVREWEDVIKIQVSSGGPTTLVAQQKSSHQRNSMLSAESLVLSTHGM